MIIRRFTVGVWCKFRLIIKNKITALLKAGAAAETSYDRIWYLNI